MPINIEKELTTLASRVSFILEEDTESELSHNSRSKLLNILEAFHDIIDDLDKYIDDSDVVVNVSNIYDIMDSIKESMEW